MTKAPAVRAAARALLLAGAAAAAYLVLSLLDPPARATSAPAGDTVTLDPLDTVHIGAAPPATSDITLAERVSARLARAVPPQPVPVPAAGAPSPASHAPPSQTLTAQATPPARTPSAWAPSVKAPPARTPAALTAAAGTPETGSRDVAAPTFAAPTFAAPTFAAPTFAAPTLAASTFAAPKLAASTLAAPKRTAPVANGWPTAGEAVPLWRPVVRQRPYVSANTARLVAPLPAPDPGGCVPVRCDHTTDAGTAPGQPFALPAAPRIRDDLGAGSVPPLARAVPGGRTPATSPPPG